MVLGDIAGKEDNSPGVKIAILRTDGQPEPFDLFLDSPDLDKSREGHFTFRFKGY